MEPFKVRILGCGSALPTLKHSASAQIIEMRGKCFMMDCGEGAQMQFRRTHVHFAKTPRSYAYCSDTRFVPGVAEKVKGVTVLYHESTYTSENEDRAKLYYHSTARQAATIAKNAGVGKLLLGHYSARYNNEEVLLNEAKEVFAESYLTQEGKVFSIE